MTYEEKLEIANKYLQGKIGLDWEDLSDINSLTDAETEEDIHDLCDERLEDAGFPNIEEDDSE
jgi:hypothetical protein